MARDEAGRGAAHAEVRWVSLSIPEFRVEMNFNRPTLVVVHVVMSHLRTTSLHYHLPYPRACTLTFSTLPHLPCFANLPPSLSLCPSRAPSRCPTFLQTPFTTSSASRQQHGAHHHPALSHHRPALCGRLSIPVRTGCHALRLRPGRSWGTWEHVYEQRAGVHCLRRVQPVSPGICGPRLPHALRRPRDVCAGRLVPLWRVWPHHLTVVRAMRTASRGPVCNAPMHHSQRHSDCQLHMVWAGEIRRHAVHIGGGHNLSSVCHWVLHQHHRCWHLPPVGPLQCRHVCGASGHSYLGPHMQPVRGRWLHR